MADVKCSETPWMIFTTAEPLCVCHQWYLHREKYMTPRHKCHLFGALVKLAPSVTEHGLLCPVQWNQEGELQWGTVGSVLYRLQPHVPHNQPCWSYLMPGHSTKTLTKVKSEEKVVAFGCILVIYKWSSGFGFVFIWGLTCRQGDTRKALKSWMELSLWCCFDADSVRKHGILLHKAVATYCESICH